MEFNSQKIGDKKRIGEEEVRELVVNGGNGVEEALEERRLEEGRLGEALLHTAQRVKGT